MHDLLQNVTKTGCFVTATDTGAGKTYVSSLLCSKTNLPYWKPLQTGFPPDDDTAIVAKTGVETYPPTYVFKTPASGHVAADVAGDCIDVKSFKKPIETPLIIEGAGGVMVPLTRHIMLIDIIEKLSVPAIVVVPNKLGCINQALLTIAALENRKIPILGIIINGADTAPCYNAKYLQGYTNVPVVQIAYKK